MSHPIEKRSQADYLLLDLFRRVTAIELKWAALWLGFIVLWIGLMAICVYLERP
jgi:hypothetical protein